MRRALFGTLALLLLAGSLLPIAALTSTVPAAQPAVALEPAPPRPLLQDATSRPSLPRATRSRRPAPRTTAPWAALAQCESGGDPTTNTGNGYYGLYQFSLQSWRAVGGHGYPHQASVAEQTRRAKMLRAEQGMRRGWPACSRHLRLR